MSAQEEMGAWTLGRWANYYCAKGQRSKVLNVISLEFSRTPLRQCVKAQVQRPPLCPPPLPTPPQLRPFPIRSEGAGLD